MKVIVTKSLQVRTGKPSLSAPSYQRLTPGSEIEVDGSRYQGDKYEGIDKWWKDAAGNYYWSGAVEESGSPGPDLAGSPGIEPEWMLNLQIPQIWKTVTGRNVGIAVVDTGININNADLPFEKNDYFIFDKSKSIQDLSGHGTHCAGIIGARNKTGNIIGVAPDCKLFICKISEKESLSDPDTLRYAEAINWCADHDEIHIISISWGSFIDDKTIIGKIQDAVNNAIKKNKIVTCSVGNASQFNDPGPLYPASLKNTIGIGSIPVENNLYPYINEFLTTVTEGFRIQSYGVNNVLREMSGTSQSNAMIAGIIALIIEKMKYTYSQAEVKNILLNSSTVRHFQGIPIPVMNGDLLLNYFKS